MRDALTVLWSGRADGPGWPVHGADRLRPLPRPRGGAPRTGLEMPSGWTREAQGGAYAPRSWQAPKGRTGTSPDAEASADRALPDHDHPHPPPEPPKEGSPGRRPGDLLLKFVDRPTAIGRTDGSVGASQSEARPPPPRLLTKVDGSKEPFDRAKLARSIVAAGASKDVAAEVASTIGQERCWRSTYEVRGRVIEMLATKAPGAMRRYAMTRRFVVKRTIGATGGVARMSPQSMSSMGLTAGRGFRLLGRRGSRKLRAEADPRMALRRNEIHLDADDMRELEVEDGESIMVKARARTIGFAR